MATNNAMEGLNWMAGRGESCCQPWITEAQHKSKEFVLEAVERYDQDKVIPEWEAVVALLKSKAGYGLGDSLCSPAELARLLCRKNRGQPRWLWRF